MAAAIEHDCAAAAISRWFTTRRACIAALFARTERLKSTADSARDARNGVWIGASRRFIGGRDNL